MKMEWTAWRSRYSARYRSSWKWALPLQALRYVGLITNRKSCGACENLTIRRSQIGSMERRTFTFEQQSAQLVLIVQGNEFLIWYDTIMNIKVDQKLSDLFRGNHSQTFNKVKKSLRPSPLLKLKACFSRQVDVVPPQAVAAKVTAPSVAVHLNLRSVITSLEAGIERPLWNSAWEKQNGGYKCALVSYVFVWMSPLKRKFLGS